MHWNGFQRIIQITVGMLLAGLASSRSAHAIGFEVSFGAMYSRTTYGLESYTWNRRWSSSLGVYLTSITSVEFSYQDVTDRNKIQYSEDTTFHDKIFSLTMVQGLLPRYFPVQPFIKLGVGQLNRDGEGFYYGGGLPPAKYDTVTAVIGAGLRIYLTRSFAIKSEITSYLSKGSIRTWRNNVSGNVGLSFQF